MTFRTGLLALALKKKMIKTNGVLVALTHSRYSDLSFVHVKTFVSQ